MNTIVTTLDTEELLKPEKTILYPNPINNFFNIILKEVSELRITDVNGSKILIKQLKGQSLLDDTSKCNQGV